jgi:hypothetical protein
VFANRFVPYHHFIRPNLKPACKDSKRLLTLQVLKAYEVLITAGVCPAKILIPPFFFVFNDDSTGPFVPGQPTISPVDNEQAKISQLFGIKNMMR